MESFWLELETILKVRDPNLFCDEESLGHVQSSRDRDSKYSPKLLPKNFFEDFLMSMPDQFPLNLEFWRLKVFV